MGMHVALFKKSSHLIATNPILKFKNYLLLCMGLIQGYLLLYMCLIHGYLFYIGLIHGYLFYMGLIHGYLFYMGLIHGYLLLYMGLIHSLSNIRKGNNGGTSGRESYN